MVEQIKPDLSFEQLTKVLDKMPVAITLIDTQKRILYYNAACETIADRKPEYIGRAIDDCHQKKQSVKKINKILEDLKTQKKNKAYYEAERNGVTAGVTVFPFELEKGVSGFAQVIVVQK